MLAKMLFCHSSPGHIHRSLATSMTSRRQALTRLLAFVCASSNWLRRRQLRSSPMPFTRRLNQRVASTMTTLDFPPWYVNKQPQKFSKIQSGIKESKSSYFTHFELVLSPTCQQNQHYALYIFEAQVRMIIYTVRKEDTRVCMHGSRPMGCQLVNV